MTHGTTLSVLSLLTLIASATFVTPRTGDAAIVVTTVTRSGEQSTDLTETGTTPGTYADANSFDDSGVSGENPFVEGTSAVSDNAAGSFANADSSVDTSEVTGDGFSGSGISFSTAFAKDSGTQDSEDELDGPDVTEAISGDLDVNVAIVAVTFTVSGPLDYLVDVSASVATSVLFDAMDDSVFAEAIIFLEEVGGGTVFFISSSADEFGGSGPDSIAMSLLLEAGKTYSFLASAESFALDTPLPGTGAFAAEAGSGFDYSLSFTAVPEPSRALLAVLGSGTGLLLRRRRSGGPSAVA